MKAHEKAIYDKSDSVNCHHETGLKEIYLAGGCFWGIQEYFSRMPGVVYTQVGYANGKTSNPSYYDVCSGDTEHAEAVHLRYNPEIITLREILIEFFSVVDPTSLNRQGNDSGTQYRSGIYFSDPEDEPTISSVISEISKMHTKPVITESEKLKCFFVAEDYHQDYLKKNPGGYCHVPLKRSDRISGKKDTAPVIDPGLYPVPDSVELSSRLNDIQLAVTQHSATETPFTGKYNEHFAPGIYVDIVTGEPLFSSTDKFESACGWPAFSRPISPEVISEKIDTSHGMRRTEIRSRSGGSHLGHVFEDGPPDRGGLRYCVNSAALDFIPLNEMESRGYGSLKEHVLTAFSKNGRMK